MPWNRNDDTDPLEIKRRKLAEQERLLAEQMSRLTEELHQSGEPVRQIIKPSEPPVWRLEDDHQRASEPTSARKRHLARQRQRDMIISFIFIAVLLVVVGIFLYLAYAPRTE